MDPLKATFKSKAIASMKKSLRRAKPSIKNISKTQQAEIDENVFYPRFNIDTMDNHSSVYSVETSESEFTTDLYFQPSLPRILVPTLISEQQSERFQKLDFLLQLCKAFQDEEQNENDPGIPCSINSELVIEKELEKEHAVLPVPSKHDDYICSPVDSVLTRASMVSSSGTAVYNRNDREMYDRKVSFDGIENDIRNRRCSFLTSTETISEERWDYMRNSGSLSRLDSRRESHVDIKGVNKDWVGLDFGKKQTKKKRASIFGKIKEFFKK